MTNKNKDETKLSNEKQPVTAPTEDKGQSEPETSTANTEASEVEETKELNKEAKVKPTEKPAKKGNTLGTLAIILVILFGGGLTYLMQKQADQYQAKIDSLEARLNASQSQIDNTISQAQKQTVEQAQAATEKVKVEINQQQKSIKSLQLAVADVKGRRPNDWLLAEADYLVKLAGRKLFLEHDVVSATRLMESADQRIAALNDPSLMSLRQSMANDITKLRTVPIIDRDGLVLRLIALQNQVDQLPLANAILPEAEKVEKQQVSSDVTDWKANLTTSLKDFSDHFITFRSRDGNVIPLLSPTQHFYLQENIKAKVETAIRAVYREQGEMYQTSLATAKDWTSKFFDPESQQVVQFMAALDKLEGQNINVDYPVKLETQSVLADIISQRLRREVTTMITEDK
ncbi:uroporphyrinogen-III C-methyltransferase [Vibrio hippocampi]|uniref:Protein HemX n=1 Tax=Vibrio hippocampi TaxID=654686 RepID=A0ABN8DL99_9VIBR|nr:uroporphyrinogen-III C-methyltransferase [Vibrio hippocampi]CAH0527399.1 Protein HemX [Vibrio hippocampi]